MVNDIGVALAPGIDFDDKRGNNYVRFSYSCEKRIRRVSKINKKLVINY